MDIRVYVLALSAFVAGLVELIIGGLLPLIAEDLNISVSVAGQLITVFAFVLSVAGPVLLVLTAKIERKRLYLWTLFLFFIGNMMAFVSPNYQILLLSRIFLAMSAALILVLALTISAKIVPKDYRARAIGVIYMGISGSLVLGVPVGVLIGDFFGWRAPFLLIACLTLVAMAVLYRYLTTIPPEPVVPLGRQLASLKNLKIFSAHLVTMFMLAGHYTLYAYFAPFLQTSLGLSPLWISICYFIFGIAAVGGGGFGGWLADRWGVGKSILTIVGIFALVLFILPWSTNSYITFPIFLVGWGMLSWSISPPKQSYLIEIAPETRGIQQSFNTSALQLGIAVGSAVGGLSVSFYPVVYNAWFGAVLAVLALVCAAFSLTRPVTAADRASETA